MKKYDEFIEANSQKLGGTPVFRGTRVPIKNLFDYLEGGDNIVTFLDDFPTVSREQVIGLLGLLRVVILSEYENAP